MGVCIDLVLAVYPQRDGDVGALWAELQAGYRADLHTGHQHLGARFQTAHVLGVKEDSVSGTEERGAFAELEQQDGQQHQTNEYKHAYLPFEP